MSSTPQAQGSPQSLPPPYQSHETYGTIPPSGQPGENLPPYQQDKGQDEKLPPYQQDKDQDEKLLPDEKLPQEPPPPYAGGDVAAESQVSVTMQPQGYQQPKTQQASHNHLAPHQGGCCDMCDDFCTICLCCCSCMAVCFE
ncbi:hypothetical protein ACOMHN_056218 [Nucella lapillus]